MSVPEPAAPAEPAIGAWLKLPAIETVELMSAAGMDLVVVDLEHSTLSFETAATLIAVARACGLRALVRVPDHASSSIQRVLDAGADGVVIPHVDTFDQARLVHRAARFPPEGVRGVGPTSRAGGWGLMPMSRYLEQTPAVIAQVESQHGLNALETMLDAGIVDEVLVGAADLSVSLGVAMDAPELATAMAAVLAICRAKNVPCGIAISADGVRARELGDQGYAFVLAGNDATILGSGFQRVVREARRSR